MPQSKKRHHSHHQHQQQHAPGNKPPVTKSGRVVKAAIIFFSIIGLLIGYFIAGAEIPWLITGAAIGGVAGYFFGRQMNNTLSK